jgi:hypothetical protein
MIFRYLSQDKPNKTLITSNIRSFTGVIRMKVRYALLITVLLMSLAAGCTSPVAYNVSPIPAQSQASTVTQVNPTAEWIADGVITSGEYSRSNSYGDYEISWRSDDKYLYIGMSARTAGWVAVAFQPGSRMKNADMVLGWVKDGKAEIQDLFSTGDFGPHQLDTELGGTNDILAYGGKEEGGTTTLEFKRLLITNDKFDIPVTNGVNKIIWAFGANDNSDLKHASRGYGEINLQ